MQFIGAIGVILGFIAGAIFNLLPIIFMIAGIKYLFF